MGIRKEYHKLTDVERNRFVEALKAAKMPSGASSSTGPALAVLNNGLHMTWKGVEGERRLFHASFDGTRWSAPDAIHRGAISSANPALAVFNNRLHMTWKRAEGDQRLFHASFDGTRWSTPVAIDPGAGSSTGPALAVFGNRLHMTWKGVEGDQRLFHASFDGTRWSALVAIDPGDPGASSSTGPALAVFGNRLHMTWKGVEGDQRLFHASFDETRWWIHLSVVDRFAELHDRHFGHLIHRSSHFLPWHREMLLRFEHELQRFHPDITIPYWDSSRDGNLSDPTGWWNNSFLGQFDSAWNLGRAPGPKPGCANLPSQRRVEANQRRGTYDAFWPELENPIHNGPHCWVGGVMGSAASPGDPVFYLHHCWIDMLWATWQRNHPGAEFVASMPGAGLNDPLMEWPDRKPADVLNHRVLGYSYDTEL